MNTTIETCEGKLFDVLNPSPDEVSLRVIARVLSRECRFGNHTTRFYSVAQHSIRVADRLNGPMGNSGLALAGLLHGASEAYLRDLPSPVKQCLPEYQKIEERVQLVIYAAFGVCMTSEKHEAIRAADREELCCEAVQLMPSRGEVWEHPPQLSSVQPIAPIEWGQAEGVFIERFARYSRNNNLAQHKYKQLTAA